ncbi:HAD family hydrolase [Loktanella salsilacus]|uniref:HAD family hydrolase n=1 Tax=Loktanella salsilacus TaxID=195913 RepID=UPI0037355D3F
MDLGAPAKSQIKGLVFDKDGTLFDFNATWGAVVRQLLVAEAGGDRDLVDRLAQALGYDLAQNRFHPGSVVIAEPTYVVAEVIAELTHQTDLQALTDRMNDLSAGVPQVHAADLPALMTQLRAQGHTLGVVTNDAVTPAIRHLKDALIEDKMAFVAGYDSGFGAKPAPGQLLAFCTATGLDPAQCAMIGDSTHDLVAGQAAGMVCIGVLTGPACREELTPHADAVLGSIADLPRWLDSRRMGTKFSAV